MTNESRSPEEIERDIERERAGLTDTLDDLQDKFSVEHIARQFSDQFREHGGDIGRSVSDAVKRNPVALAITGVGLAWLMMGDKSNGRDRYDRDRRFGRSDYDDRYGADRYDRDYGGRTDLPGRASSVAQTRVAGSQSSDATKPSYSGRYGSHQDTPSWARPSDDESSVGNKVRDVASSTGDSISGAVSSVAETARNAGSAVAETTKGAADASRDAGKSMADSAHNLASAASERAAALRDRLSEGTENLTEEARNRVVAARERALEARDAAASYARRGRERAVDIFEDQPLIAGALAVALGAALGAALPRSRIEDQYLGETSDQLMDEAERIFEEEKQKLGEVAKAATDEAKNIVREAKDNADDAAPADTAAQAVADKAKAAGERIVNAAESEAKKQDVGAVKKS
ncbi:DUF3618 domain-containing protein [Sulfitobacter sp. F26169L]|uniref:DUF3618 domain-containing protein n=1 Tax=Sulfitobacter sp. F26169L TaxID=2996015 RepID=UPI002260F605|nr:DUF3618 domain-containing protein [Sulfitobacter sp. F26169L]MCX7568195.1 DUF3618 domain-containing protein [Sulfitobacter sp. F26169L]